MSSGRFTFRLQRLLALRQMAERAATISLASAQSVATEAQATRARIAGRRASARATMASPAGTERRIAELHQAAFLVEQLDAHVARADRTTTTADQHVHDCRGRLAERVKERRIIERLRERHVAEWTVGVAREERAVMDAIARPSTAAHDDSSPSTRP